MDLPARHASATHEEADGVGRHHGEELERTRRAVASPVETGSTAAVDAVALAQRTNDLTV